MAVNKNFVVKNGLEVDTNTLFVDSANNRVAIGTTVPTASLDVRGKILSDSQVESWVGKFVGIVTAGAVGVTTLTYSVGTGSSTKLGRANAEELNVTSGFSTFLSASATDIIVATGSTFSKDLSVGAAATVGAALTVTGQSKFAEFVRFEKDVTVGSALTVTGISTFTGATKFAESSRFEQNINVGGAATVGGALTVTGNAYFNGNVDIGGDLTFDEVNARNLNITGIATLGFSTAANAYVECQKPKYNRNCNTWFLNCCKCVCRWYYYLFIVACRYGCNDGQGARNTSNQSWYQLSRPCIYFRCRW